MVTLASDWIRWYANEWDRNTDLASATLSGIVGDPAHQRTGGYHISIEDQPSSTNYSVVRPGDKAPPGAWSRKHASAVDMSMNTADMIKDWNRVFQVWADHSDPRRKYFNAYNGWNGRGEAERLDFIANTRKVTTPDHKWHAHDENPRMYWNDSVAFDAKLSVHRGESKASYIARTSGGGMADAATNADRANWWGGSSMGPAVPEEYRTLRMDPVDPVDSQGYFGNDQNSRLFYIQSMVEELRQTGIPSNVTISAQDLDLLASKVGQQVAAAVVSDQSNQLTDADLDNVRQVAVSAAKQALREGGTEIGQG